MILFLDENLPAVAVGPLASIFGSRHDFVHAAALGLVGVDDIDLYPKVRAAGVDAIVSKDGRQLFNEIERRGLFDNHLSFIALRETKTPGAKGFAMLVASLTAGLANIEEKWDPAEPSVFRLRALQTKFSERVGGHYPLWRPEWGPRPT